MCPEVQPDDYHVSILENNVENASDEKLTDGNFLQILAATARRHPGRPLVNCGVRPGLTRGVRKWQKAPMGRPVRPSTNSLHGATWKTHALLCPSKIYPTRHK